MRSNLQAELLQLRKLRQFHLLGTNHLGLGERVARCHVDLFIILPPAHSVVLELALAGAGSNEFLHPLSIWLALTPPPADR